MNVISIYTKGIKKLSDKSFSVTFDICYIPRLSYRERDISSTTSTKRRARLSKL